MVSLKEKNNDFTDFVKVKWEIKDASLRASVKDFYTLLKTFLIRSTHLTTYSNCNTLYYFY